MVNVITEIHAIKPRKDVFSSKSVRAMVLNEMRGVAKLIKQDLDSTAEYWLHKPEFGTVLRYKGGDPLIKVGLVGSSIGNQYWERVNRGTHYMPWKFLPGYMPMTSVPGQFYNNQPRTKLLVYKVYYRKSRAKIHARNWIGTRGAWGALERKRADYFRQAMEFAIRRGLGEI